MVKVTTRLVGPPTQHSFIFIVFAYLVTWTAWIVNMTIVHYIQSTRSATNGYHSANSRSILGNRPTYSLPLALFGVVNTLGRVVHAGASESPETKLRAK